MEISSTLDWLVNVGSTIFYFLLVLGVLVLVHEIGHFVTARWAGVRVEEFGLGYPPRALTLWKGAGWIQVQGKKIHIPRTFNLPGEIRAGSWVTYKTQIENGRETLVGITPISAEDRGLTLASQVQNIDRGTIYSLNWLPLGGFVRMTGEEDPSDPLSFARQSWWKRAIILTAGSAMNLFLAILIFIIIAMVGIPKPRQLVFIQAIAPDSPAAAAGIQIGDRVMAIDGIAVKNGEEVLRYTFERTGQEMTVDLRRGRDNVSIRLMPRVNPPKGQGPMGVTLSFQSAGPDEIVQYPIWEAIPQGFKSTADVGVAIVSGFQRMIRGTAPAQVGGPVEIARITGVAAQLGWVRLLEFTALLSINLAIMNMLPIPALDGGRLLFIVVEVLRGGRRIAPEKEGFVHIAGMALLLLLMVIITFFDVQRMLGG